jgi:hypothetical protein
MNTLQLDRLNTDKRFENNTSGMRISRSLGQVEAYFTVREILAEASKGADGVLWREFSGFGRFRFATLGLIFLHYISSSQRSINHLLLPLCR